MAKVTIDIPDVLYNRLCCLTIAVDAGLSHEDKFIGKTPQLPYFHHEPGPTVVLACERLVAAAAERLGPADAGMLDNPHASYHQFMREGGTLSKMFKGILAAEDGDDGAPGRSGA